MARILLHRVGMRVKSTTQFTPEILANQVPPLAMRYLTHAIRPGAILAHQAQVSFHGQVRLKPTSPWLSFRGRETIELGQAFHVTAHARLGPLPVTTQDWYEHESTSSRILLLGFIPIRTKKGKDAARSAQSRLIVESTWLPSTFLPAFGAQWTEQGEALQVTVPVHNESVQLTMHLNEKGGLRQFYVHRWSDLTKDGRYAWIPFATSIEAEQTFGDYTIPSFIRSSWWAGTDQEFEFFRTTVDDVQYHAS